MKDFVVLTHIYNPFGIVQRWLMAVLSWTIGSLCLRKPLLSRLHRSHAGQLTMVDAAQYIWWPRMHRDIVQLCKDCLQCTKFGKNLKANASFNSTKPLPPFVWS